MKKGLSLDVLVGLVEGAGPYPLPESPLPSANINILDVVEVVVIIVVAAEPVPSKESPVSSG